MLIPFRITDPPKDAPLFFRRTIRGGRCVAIATGRPPRRSNAEKEQEDRVDLYCELVLDLGRDRRYRERTGELHEVLCDGWGDVRDKGEDRGGRGDGGEVSSETRITDPWKPEWS